MLDVLLLFLAVFLGCWWWLRRSTRGDPKDPKDPKDPRCLPLPPGPGGGVPFLGHLPLLDRDPRPQFALWRQQYGDVFSFYMARRLVVVLNGYDTIREALVKRADDFSVRPSMFVTEVITRKGIAFNSGSSWKEQRKLSLEILRSLGMGKARFTSNITREVRDFLGALRDLEGRPADLAEMVGVSMSNNVCNVVFGRRFSYNNASFLRYLQLMRENLQLLRSTNLLNYMPCLSYLPGDLFGAKKILRNVAEMERCFLIPQIQAHIDASNRLEREKAFKNNNDHHDDDETDDDGDDDEHADFISAYLAHIKRDQACGKLTGSLNENLENLEWTVSDLFVAGSETMTKALLWTLLYLLHHPRVQTACFRQIRDTIGLDTPPEARHRKELPYVEATILETLRVADIAALGLQHGVARDVEFRGCFIPSSAIVVPYLHTALTDSKTWADPHCFRPERFLHPDPDSDSGRGGALVKREELIPFSVGRRACPGEGVARLQLFLYVTSLIQHFRFMPEDEGQLPSLEGVMEFTHTPDPFRIRAVPRNGSADE